MTGVQTCALPILVFNHVELVIVLNKDWETKLNEQFPKSKICVVHNPIRIKQEKPILRDKKPDPFKVLFMGFFIESKGIVDLLEVAKSTKHLDNIRYIICGKGELENKILDESKINSNIEFKGWVSGPEKEEILKDADLLFLPSYKEGLPIIILEAMSFSLPILSTNISGIPEEVDEGKNGILKSPGDVRGYISSIDFFSNMDKDSLNHYRKASFEKSLLFSSEKIYHDITNIYSKIISNNKK